MKLQQGEMTMEEYEHKLWDLLAFTNRVVLLEAVMAS